MSANKNAARKASGKTPAKRRWVAKVHTESTYPPEGLFTKSAATIAKALASKKVSPKGPASGMRMLNYYINRAGHNLTDERREELEKAKALLSEKIAAQKKSAPDIKTHRSKKAA